MAASTLTMNNILIAALKRVDILDNIETAASASDGQYALDTLNRMMHGWKSMGVDVNHSTLASTGTFPLDEKHEDGVIALLAKRMATDYGIEISPDLRKEANDAWIALQADYKVIEKMKVDDSLAFTPSQRRWDG